MPETPDSSGRTPSPLNDTEYVVQRLDPFDGWVAVTAIFSEYEHAYRRWLTLSARDDANAVRLVRRIATPWVDVHEGVTAPARVPTP